MVGMEVALSEGMPKRHLPSNPDCIFHVMNRGVNGDLIFKDSRDHLTLLSFAKTAAELMGVEIYAYCLMSNHFHFLMRPKKEPLPKVMWSICRPYAVYFNQRHHRTGPVFQSRYKALLVADEPYLNEVVSYIHANPVKAELVSSPLEYRWSSGRAYQNILEAPDWLNTDYIPEPGRQPGSIIHGRLNLEF